MGEPRECSAEEYARDQEAQQAFREVSARYRAANEDIDRLMMNAGQATDMPSLEKYARDQFLEGGKSFGVTFAKNGYRLSEPIPTKSVTLRSYSADELTVLACADGREVQVLDAETDEVLHSGDLAAIEVTAEKRGGEWLLVAAQNMEEEECDW